MKKIILITKIYIADNVIWNQGNFYGLWSLVRSRISSPSHFRLLNVWFMEECIPIKNHFCNSLEISFIFISPPYLNISKKSVIQQIKTPWPYYNIIISIIKFYIIIIYIKLTRICNVTLIFKYNRLFHSITIAFCFEFQR